MKRAENSHKGSVRLGSLRREEWCVSLPAITAAPGIGETLGTKGFFEVNPMKGEDHRDHRGHRAEDLLLNESDAPDATYGEDERSGNGHAAEASQCTTPP